MTPTPSPTTSRKSATPGRSEVGFATSVGFPKAGVGAKGNSGVTATVKATKGAIGYISASYLIAAGLGAAALQNKAGNYELPNLKNIAVGGRLPEEAVQAEHGRASSTRRRSRRSPTRSRRSPTRSSRTTARTWRRRKTFAKYAVTVGQKYGAALDFAPLPKFVKQAALRAIGSLVETEPAPPGAQEFLHPPARGPRVPRRLFSSPSHTASKVLGDRELRTLGS